MEVKTMKVVIYGHGNRMNLDEFDLAGLKLIEKHKRLMKEIGLSARSICNVTPVEFKKLSDAFKELSENFNRQNINKDKIKVRNWEKKRFYD